LLDPFLCQVPDAIYIIRLVLYRNTASYCDMDCVHRTSPPVTIILKVTLLPLTLLIFVQVNSAAFADGKLDLIL